MKIKINNENYILDVEGAIDQGLLEKEKQPVKVVVGGIYKNADNKRSPFLCIKASWGTKDSYQLLGRRERGSSSNIDPFFFSLHSEQEIQEYLERRNMHLVATLSHHFLDRIVDGSGEDIINYEGISSDRTDF